MLTLDELIDPQAENLQNLLFQKIISKIRPSWELSTTKFHTFQDGITNKMYGIWHEENCDSIKNSKDGIVLRINGNGTENFIDRNKEIESWKILEDAGAAPKLFCVFGNGLCMQFVKGSTLTIDSIRDKTVSSKIAEHMAKCHSLDSENSVPGCYFFPEKFLKGAKQFPGKYTKEFLVNGYQKFKETLSLKSEVNKKLSFCHNDLLLGNVLYDSETGIVNFIDYEYAHMNFAGFDIANHFCEYTGLDVLDYEKYYPDLEHRKEFCKKYLVSRLEKDEVSEEMVNELVSDCEIMAISSHYFWGCWALMQADISDIDFDYLNYAVQRFDEMCKIDAQIGLNNFNQ